MTPLLRLAAVLAAALAAALLWWQGTRPRTPAQLRARAAAILERAKRVPRPLTTQEAIAHRQFLDEAARLERGTP